MELTDYIVSVCRGDEIIIFTASVRDSGILMIATQAAFIGSRYVHIMEA